MAWIVLFISILCPPLGIIGGLFGVYKDYSKWKCYVFCMALGIASIAYCYIPKGDPDIIRYWEFVEDLKPLSFHKAINTDMHGDEKLYVYTAFAWLCAKIGDIHLLPACSVFIVYYIGFYITCQIGKDYRIKRSTVIVYLVFIMLALDFYAVVNNVRNVCAFTMVSMAVFREAYQKKRDPLTLILYIAPVFIHTSAVLIILIRIAAQFTGKLKVIMFLLVSNIMLIIDLAFSVFTKIGSGNIVIVIIRNMVVKAHFYFHNTTSSWGAEVQRSLSFKIDRYLNVLFAFIICMIILMCKEKHNKRDSLLRIFQLNTNESKGEFIKNYVFLLALATISCLPMIMPEYWRFYSITVITASLPFLLMANSKYQYKRLLAYSIFIGIPLDGLIVTRFLLYCDRFSLFFKPFISSPIAIIIKNL